VMSMLNAHTASNGALMMTACADRNGGLIRIVKLFLCCA